MDGQQVPNLEEMDGLRARRFLEELYAVPSAEKEYAVRHEDYIMEMPQFGVSSSAVRERAAAGRPLRYLVPEAVARFIEEKGIYS